MAKSKWIFKIDPEACYNCATCQDVCNKDAIYIEDYFTYAIDMEKCNGCSRCYKDCPVEAIERIPAEKAS